MTHFKTFNISYLRDAATIFDRTVSDDCSNLLMPRLMVLSNCSSSCTASASFVHALRLRTVLDDCSNLLITVSARLCACQRALICLLVGVVQLDWGFIYCDASKIVMPPNSSLQDHHGTPLRNVLISTTHVWYVIVYVLSLQSTDKCTDVIYDTYCIVR